jgi:hypothetical protein
MDGCRRLRIACLAVVFGSLLPLLPATAYAQVPGALQPPGMPNPVEAQEEPGHIENFVRHVWGYVDPDNAEITSVHQLACLIDHLEHALWHRGQVVVKNPDVWGQNRLTLHRSEYEANLKKQLDSFEIILNSYQRVSDAAALTSATSIGASLGPPGGKGAPATAASIPSAVGLVGPTGLVMNANQLLAGSQTPVLTPANLGSLTLGNQGAAAGIGLESKTIIDERSDFLQYVQELRRVNTGDDRSDMPGYGLYLVRVPVSILPGAASIKGRGAVVTVQAKHNLTGDLLANTFRTVVILDTAYQLLDAVTRGQFLPLDDVDYNEAEEEIRKQPNKCVDSSDPAPNAQALRARAQTRRMLGRPSIVGSGKTPGVQGAGPGSEIVPIYGSSNLRRLVAAVKQDEEGWYRHDPSILSWLLSELSAAYTFMREQAKLGNPAFQAAVFENIGHHVLTRNYKALMVHRENWLRASAQARHDQIRPIDVLAFAIMVQSIFVDRQLKFDMQVMAQRKHTTYGDPDQYSFLNLLPDEQAKRAFNSYVEVKWPIHVFTMDPLIEQQNRLDLYSERTQLQLALALALSSGQVSLQQATTYARNLEKDMDLIALNRTAIGFGAGESTFGWRFYPRIQTPPTQSNLARVAGILINNGPGTGFDMRNRQIEPGPRDCYALMVLPNFVSSIRLTTVTNWFDLKTNHNHGQALSTTDMVHLGRKLQTARNALQKLCDSGRYRPTDVESLGERLDQLDAMLPIQAHSTTLPFESDLAGSEIFNSNNAALAPRLLTWYGEPASSGSSIFILGTGFHIDSIKVIVGGVTLSDPGGNSPSYDLISRNVLRVDIPPDATPIPTPIKTEYPGTEDPGTASGNKQASPQAKPSKQGHSSQSAPADCQTRQIFDIHVATPNGISNHLLVEITPPASSNGGDNSVKTSVTTTTTVNGGQTITKTEFATTPPGIVLPPGTFLPMGTNLPAGGTFVAPGAGTVNGAPVYFPPGTVPSTFYQPMPSPGSTGNGGAQLDSRHATDVMAVRSQPAASPNPQNSTPPSRPAATPDPARPNSLTTVPQIPSAAPPPEPSQSDPAAARRQTATAVSPLSATTVGKVDGNVLRASRQWIPNSKSATSARPKSAADGSTRSRTRASGPSNQRVIPSIISRALDRSPS